MLRPNDIALVELCLEIGNFKYLLGLFRQRDIADRERGARRTDRIFDRFFDLVKVGAEIPKNLDSDALAFANDTQEQVLRSDVIMAQPYRFLPREADDVLNSV